MYACIVTCGGLCPGLNTVIREIVCGLYYMYGVNKVLGIEVTFKDHIPITLLCVFICNCDRLVPSIVCREDIEVFILEIRFH